MQGLPRGRPRTAHELTDRTNRRRQIVAADDNQRCIGELDARGAFAAKTWFEAQPEDWLHFYQTDVVSAVGLIPALVPNMRERQWGRVIQLASGQAAQPSAVMADYGAAKAAIVNLSVSLSRELAGSGVTANTVSPGLIKTSAAWKFVLEKAAQDSWGNDEREIEKRWMTEVLKAPSGTRAGSVEEVAAVVTFLASPLATTSTAQISVSTVGRP